jgi:transposase
MSWNGSLLRMQAARASDRFPASATEQPFARGRFAAWLGIVPRQHSTGGKAKLLGISAATYTFARF